MPTALKQCALPISLPRPDGGVLSWPTVMTEEELIRFLRIPEISNSKDHCNVIENLKRLPNLPRIHICNKALYPKEAIPKWIEQQITTGKQSWVRAVAWLYSSRIT